MVKSRFCVAALSLLIFCAFGAKAAEETVFYVVDFPPYTMISDVDDSVSGMDVEVVKAAFESVGMAVSFKVLPWKRILKSMEIGSIAGTVSCSFRENRTQFMAFSLPLSISERIVLSRNELDTGSIHTFSDLASYSLVTVEGWGVQEELQENRIPHQSSPDIEGALKAVRYRDVDLMYLSEAPARYYAKKLGLQDQVKITRMNEVKSASLHLCLSKFYPNYEWLLEQANQGLENIKASGRYDSIRQKYIF